MTAKSNFSNDPKAALHDSLNSGHIGVLIKQGVPLLDQDLNLLGNLPVELMRRALRLFVGDGVMGVVGDGAMSEDFKVELAERKVTVSPGHCVLDGIVLERKTPSTEIHFPLARADAVHLVYVAAKSEEVEGDSPSVGLRTSLRRVATATIAERALTNDEIIFIRADTFGDVRGESFRYSPAQLARLSTPTGPYLPLALIVRRVGDDTCIDVRKAFKFTDVERRVDDVERLIGRVNGRPGWAEIRESLAVKQLEVVGDVFVRRDETPLLALGSEVGVGAAPFTAKLEVFGDTSVYGTCSSRRVSVRDPDFANAREGWNLDLAVEYGHAYFRTGSGTGNHTFNFCLDKGGLDWKINPQKIAVQIGGDWDGRDGGMGYVKIGGATLLERVRKETNGWQGGELDIQARVDGRIRVWVGAPVAFFEAGGVKFPFGISCGDWRISEASGAQKLAFSFNGADKAHFDTNGNLRIGNLEAVQKNFVIAHPQDPLNRELVHSAVEGPEAAVFYRGDGCLENGVASVKLPAYFEALTRPDGRTVQVTPRWKKGENRISPLAATEVRDSQFLVRGIDDVNPSQGFFWEVKAIRADCPRLEVERPLPRNG